MEDRPLITEVLPPVAGVLPLPPVAGVLPLAAGEGRLRLVGTELRLVGTDRAVEGDGNAAATVVVACKCIRSQC